MQKYKDVFVPQLNRELPLFEEVALPNEGSTEIFLDLIGDLKNELKDKSVLDIGCGAGPLTILCARYGAHVTSVDISESAVENTKLSINQETKDVQDRILIGKSDLYKDLKDITSKVNERFQPPYDFIFGNIPIFYGDDPKNKYDRRTFAGTGFVIPLMAVKQLPEVLKESGKGYFLIAECKKDGPLHKFWNFDYFKTAVSMLKGWSCELTNYKTNLIKEPIVDIRIVEVKH